MRLIFSVQLLQAIIFFFFLQLRDDPRVRLDYPFLHFFENKFFLPLHLYGVKLGGAKGIESIEMIHLHYPIPSTDHASSAYRISEKLFCVQKSKK